MGVEDDLEAMEEITPRAKTETIDFALNPNKSGLAYENNIPVAVSLLLNFKGDCICGEFYSIHGHCFRCGDRIETEVSLRDLIRHDGDCLGWQQESVKTKLERQSNG